MPPDIRTRLMVSSAPEVPSLWGNLIFTIKIREIACHEEGSTNMKITSFSQKLSFQERQKKKEGKEKRKTPYQDEKLPVSEEWNDVKWEDTVNEFLIEMQQEAPQLKVSIEKNILGPKIILSDEKGYIIRQWTPEKFLQFRQHVGKGKKSLGKILDQKL